MKPTAPYEHIARIRQELHDAGVTRFGAKKFAAEYLPNVVHPDEHIRAVVYGRYREGGTGKAFLGMVEGMLVATNYRIIFLDHKPGYTNIEELPYEIVVGVKEVKAGPFAAIILFTRLGNYAVRFAKVSCVEQFVHYIETRRVDQPGNGFTTRPVPVATPNGSSKL